MQTADLCDISDLVWGGYRHQTEDAPWSEVCDPVPLQYVNESPQLDVSQAVQAIDAVTAKYPGAHWATFGDHGRIVCGDRLISLSMATIDPDAELLAWTDAAGRLGNGRSWNR